MPARLPCTYKVRSELLLRRERCHHHTVRVCDAALLVRFDPVWCTFASSVHQAASTRPVRERWRGHVECSVNTFYSVCHEQDTFISIRATTARSYHHSLTDVTQDARSTDSLRDFDAASKKYCQRGGHDENVQEEKVAEPPGLVTWRRGSRARPCGVQALVSAASNTQHNQTHRTAGGRLQHEETPPSARDGQQPC